MRKMHRGYLLAEAMIAVIIAGVIAGVFTTMNYYTHLQSNTLKHQNTKIILDVVRSRLLHLAKDVDNDSFFELLKEDSNSTLPLDVGIGVDAWGQRIFYATVDLGDSNDVNTSYANTSTSISPNANIVGRLVSAGQDMLLQTSPSDSIAQGDDLMLETGIGELNHFKLYGSSEIATQTRGYNSAIISDVAPDSPINGTLWYDTSVVDPLARKLKIYEAETSSWREL